MSETITFTDGRTFEVPASWPAGSGPFVTHLDADGFPVHDASTPSGDGFIKSQPFLIGLTMCCGASFTGSMDGVVCRSCYLETDGNDNPVAPVVGRAA